MVAFAFHSLKLLLMLRDGLELSTVQLWPLEELGLYVRISQFSLSFSTHFEAASFEARPITVLVCNFG